MHSAVVPRRHHLSRLAELGEILRQQPRPISITQALGTARASYCATSLSPQTQAICRRAGISLPSDPPEVTAEDRAVVERILIERGFNWGDWRTHLSYRLHITPGNGDSDFPLLFDIAPWTTSQRDRLARLILNGEESTLTGGQVGRRFYDFSLLPLNMLLGQSVQRYFVPPPDTMRPHQTKRPDPYGLLWAEPSPGVAGEDAGATVAIWDADTRLLLASQKFQHTALLNIDFSCPIGCADCYKTRLGTREHLARSDAVVMPDAQLFTAPDGSAVVPPRQGNLDRQAAGFLRFLTEHPRGQRIYDVIVSGGEPLMVPDDRLEMLLNTLARAEHLKVIRFCTGTLFLGLPWRISDSLVNMLSAFTERTGIRVSIHAHLAAAAQITPEAVDAVHRLRKHGISVYSQVPIKDGINFFLGNPERTVSELATLGRLQVSVGVEPYMWIVDMHPTSNSFYVPIEPLLASWAALVESHDYPGNERPRTLSILFEQGNVILSAQLLLAMRKHVDTSHSVVRYEIPRLAMDSSGRSRVERIIHYIEPLTAYNNDPGSLSDLQRQLTEG